MSEKDYYSLSSVCLSLSLNLCIHAMTNQIFSRMLSSMKLMSQFFHYGTSIEKKGIHLSVVVLGHRKLNLVTEIRASNFQRETSLMCPHFINV